MDWLHPTYFWALGIVALVAGLLAWAAYQRTRAWARFGGLALAEQLAASVRPLRRYGKAALTVGAALLVAISLAGPRTEGGTRTVERTGMDLIIALDVSLSMTAEDVAPNRLARAKNAIRDLLDTLSGDRVGLVLFAGDGFVQCPLTTDYDAVRLFLDVADPSALATPGTNLHAAFRAAQQAFASTSDPVRAAAAPDAPRPKRTRAVLFVSDGENHVGEAKQVAEDARTDDVVLFSAGVGSPDGARIPLYDQDQLIGFKKDNRGQIVQTRLHEESLTTLAQDGAYFQISQSPAALTDLKAYLTRLNRTSLGTEQVETYDERYQWPLAAALLLLLAERLIRVRRRAAGSRPQRWAQRWLRQES